MVNNWTANNIPDQSGRVAMVTGANSGLGYESSRELARKGATVIMACRNPQKAERAKAQILAEIPNAQLQLMALDLGRLASVHAFVEAFRSQYDRLDILLNNAGVMAIPQTTTEDGFEMQMAVNYYGHFVLTARLFDLIVNRPHSRIVNLSSVVQYGASIQFDDLNWERNYSRWGVYGQTKLAMTVFANELDRRLKSANIENTRALSAHPGFSITNLQGTSADASGHKGEAWAFKYVIPHLGQSQEMGALPQLYAATSSDAMGGKFYGPRWWARGYPAECPQTPAARRVEDWRKLWERTEELTQTPFNVSA